jgi:hypothetical protein
MENIKKFFKKKWFAKENRHILIWSALVIGILLLVLLLYKNDRVSALRDVVVFSKHNHVLALLAFLLIMSAVLFFITWGAAGLGWILKKISFVTLLFLAIILWLYREKINLAPLEKAKINSNYQKSLSDLKSDYNRKLDSMNTAFKRDDKRALKILEKEDKQLKNDLFTLRQSFDSVVFINKATEKEMINLKGIMSSLRIINDSMSFSIEDFKNRMNNLSFVVPEKVDSIAVVAVKEKVLKKKKNQPKKRWYKYKPPKGY